MCYWLLRQDDDNDVQPVPWVSEEGELSNTEASGHNLYNGFECVDCHEHVSVWRKKNAEIFKNNNKKTKVDNCIKDNNYINQLFLGLWLSSSITNFGQHIYIHGIFLHGVAGCRPHTHVLTHTHTHTHTMHISSWCRWLQALHTHAQHTALWPIHIGVKDIP